MKVKYNENTTNIIMPQVTNYCKTRVKNTNNICYSLRIYILNPNKRNGLGNGGNLVIGNLQQNACSNAK